MVSSNGGLVDYVAYRIILTFACMRPELHGVASRAWSFDFHDCRSLLSELVFVAVLGLDVCLAPSCLPCPVILVRTYCVSLLVIRQWY